MKLSATLITGLFLAFTAAGLAQNDWDRIWENYPPVGIPQHPNSWMNDPASYTGLAYDRLRDVLYIVNPGVCVSGPTTTLCPKVYIWEASTGLPATGLGMNGELNVDLTVVQGGFSGGKYALYKIDVDENGRIFASNLVAPLWTDQGPWRLYRWNDPSAMPELVYQTQGSPGAGEMKDAVWGTSFDVVGRDFGGGPGGDSVRIFVSGGDIPGFINDEINVIVTDERPAAPYAYRLGLKMPYYVAGTNYAGSGIAATLPGYIAPVVASNASLTQTVIVNQRQSGSVTLPQTYTATAYATVPWQLNGPGGPLSFLPPTNSHFSHIFVANQMPAPGTMIANDNTHVRSIAFSANPPMLWPPTETPALGSEVFDNPVGGDNYITDVDHTTWINPQTGLQHIQLFVLMSNNGIACYRSKNPMPVPVDFSAFSATSDGVNVRLVWQVAYESNNYGFDVQRSFDGGSGWETIGFVGGNGSSNKLAEFSFNDPLTSVHRDAGKVFYRLKQIDQDGTFMFSPIAEALVAEVPEGIVLHQNYPNPFGMAAGNAKTTISYGLSQSGEVTLSVFNAFGERIATLVHAIQSAGLHHAAFDATGMPSGVYVYRIVCNGSAMQKSLVLTQ